MSAWPKKVKALDPHSRYPQVGPGEAADRASLPHEMRTVIKSKCPGVPRPGHLLPTTRFETLAKVFLVNLPASVKKKPFLATDRSISPDPDFSSEANQHPLIELLSADNVLANSQVISARAQTVLASKGPMERLARRRQSFIKLFNH